MTGKKRKKSGKKTSEVLQFAKESEARNQRFMTEMFEKQQEIEKEEREKDRKFLLEMANILKGNK